MTLYPFYNCDNCTRWLMKKTHIACSLCGAVLNCTVSVELVQIELHEPFDININSTSILKYVIMLCI